jgi:CubicO group peptidase (beta-lactamase class C family)
MLQLARRIVLSIAAIFALSIPCVAGTAPAVSPLPLASSPEAVGFSSARLQRLDAAMAQPVSDGRVVGLQYLLARHGRIVATNSYGKMSLASGQPMQRNAIFRIFSMTKPITGVAMMILFEEGKWRLDDPVTKFLPELKDLKVWKGVDAQGKPILEPVKRPPTMRELMSHTAGFGYGLSDQDPVDKMFQDEGVLTSNGLAEMTGKVAGIPLLFQPGEGWSYSVAADLQGAIIERLSGQTFGQFMHSRIFTPLGMRDTGFVLPADQASRLAAAYYADSKTGQLLEATTTSDVRQISLQRAMRDYSMPPTVESGGSGLVSTTADYARFEQMLANGGELDGVRILSPASVELMRTNVIPQTVLSSSGARGDPFNEAIGFGLDFQVVNDPRKAGSLVGKDTMSWGGAAGTWFWIDPTNDVIFVGMVQRFGGLDDLAELSQTLVYQALVDPAK